MLSKNDNYIIIPQEEFSKFFQPAGKPEPTSSHVESWVNGKELCNLFPLLSYGKVKARKWRDENDFPYYQDDLYCKVSYNTADVAIWIKSHLKKNKSTRHYS